MSWYNEARAVILAVHHSLREDATLEQRIQAVDEAYPFIERRYFPYKMWLKARREYLCRFGYQPKGQPIHESPLERMIRRAKQKETRT